MGAAAVPFEERGFRSGRLARHASSTCLFASSEHFPFSRACFLPPVGQSIHEDHFPVWPQPLQARIDLSSSPSLHHDPQSTPISRSRLHSSRNRTLPPSPPGPPPDKKFRQPPLRLRNKVPRLGRSHRSSPCDPRASLSGSFQAGDSCPRRGPDPRELDAPLGCVGGDLGPFDPGGAMSKGAGVRGIWTPLAAARRPAGFSRKPPCSPYLSPLFRSPSPRGIDRSAAPLGALQHARTTPSWSLLRRNRAPARVDRRPRRTT